MPSPTAPTSRREDVREVLHGVEVADPYRWLEDQEAPETRAWIAEQRAYIERVLADCPSTEGLRARAEELSRSLYVSVPSVRGNRYFHYRRSAEQEHPVFCVREGLDGEERVLLDPHTMSEDLSLTVSVSVITEDGEQVLYGIRKGGEDELSYNLLDVATGAVRENVLPRARYFGVDLTRDKRTLYWVRFTPEGPRAYRRALEDEGEGEMWYGEGLDARKGIGLALSECGRWMLISIWYGAGASRNDLYLRDLGSDGPIVPVAVGIPATFSGQIVDGKLWLQTDWEAPKGRVLLCDPERPEPENWREFLAEDEHVLQGLSLAGGAIYASYLEDVVPSIRVLDREGRVLRVLPTPGLGSLYGVWGRWDAREVFTSFESFATPSTTYVTDVASGETRVWTRRELPVRSEEYEVRQLWATSKDGTRVPMFVCNRKGLLADGQRPTLISGYGGFRGSLTPGFQTRAVVMSEYDGLFVLVNLRGGEEFGEAWHQGGMLGNKQNVFDDLYACAEALIAEGWTCPEKLAVAGGSNGGLLVGAALTQRPDLFRAISCGYPLLDMVRYHKFLLGPLWVDEYGSADDPEQFAWLHAYSPYHHVVEGERYPAVYFQTGDADTRVAPLHARKMCALLQSASGSGLPVVLHYEEGMGHSGGRTVSQATDDFAREMGFLLWQLGALPKDQEASRGPA